MSEEAARRKKLILLLGAIGAAIVLGGAGLVFLLGGSSEPTQERPRRSSSRGTSAPAVPESGRASGSSDDPKPIVRIVETAPPPPPPVKINVVEAPPPKPPAAPGADPVPPPKPPPGPDWRRIVDRSLPLLNMAGLGAELTRHQRDTAGYDRMVSLMADHERRVREGLTKLAEKGTPYNIAARLAPHDRLLWFSGKDFSQMQAGEIVAHLQNWMKQFRPGALEKVTVQRGSSTLEIFMYFPERNSDLLDIMNLAGVSVEAPLAGPSVPLKLPEDFVKSISERFDALPAGYRRLVPPEELEKMDALLKKGKGFPDEIEFLRWRIAGDLLPRFEREAAQCRSRVKELEPDLLDTVTDRVLMTDGRVLEGKVKGEDATAITLWVGVGTVKLNKDDVKEIQKEKGISCQFPARYKAAQGKVENLVALMAWCKESRFMVRQKEYLAQMVLTLDPLNDKARAELNWPKSFASKAALPTPAPPPPPSAAAEAETARKVADLAAETVRKYKTFSDIVSQMRDRTQGLTYSRNVAIPDRFNHIAALIGDPIEFKAANLNREKAGTIQTWWNDLDTGSREEFARFYGLWCIAWRALKK